MKIYIAPLTLAISVSCLALFPLGSEAATTVNLGTAENFAILSEAGISTTEGTSIVGDIGVSPIASTAITGFDLILDSSGRFSTSSLVTGQVFASDYAPPTPMMLSVAILDMQAAYSDAAGRVNPDFLNLSAGSLNGETLTAGLYKWASGLLITNSITFDGEGDSNAVWILQIDNRLALANGADIILSGGAQARNIFWQTAEGATLGTNSSFEGILLSATDIAVQTDAALNANLYAQTAVTLDNNSIAQVVPEPASAALFGLGILGFVVVRRRKSV